MTEVCDLLSELLNEIANNGAVDWDSIIDDDVEEVAALVQCDLTAGTRFKIKLWIENYLIAKQAADDFRDDPSWAYWKYEDETSSAMTAAATENFIEVYEREAQVSLEMLAGLSSDQRD